MQRLIDLLDYVWDIIEASGQEIKRPDIQMKHVVNEPAASFKKERYQVVKYLKKSINALRKSGFERLGTMIVDSVDLLTWSQNESFSTSILGEHFMNNYVFGQLTGSGGPIDQDAPPSGFLLLGPNTFYRHHHHQPDEVYMVFSTDIEWCLDNKEWFPVSPGEVIYHAPNQSHAIRTKEIPMLAFSSWLQEGQRVAIHF